MAGHVILVSFSVDDGLTPAGMTNEMMSHGADRAEAVRLLGAALAATGLFQENGLFESWEMVFADDRAVNGDDGGEENHYIGLAVIERIARELQ